MRVKVAELANSSSPCTFITCDSLHKIIVLKCTTAQIYNLFKEKTEHLITEPIMTTRLNKFRNWKVKERERERVFRI